MGLNPSTELETGVKFNDRYLLERLLGSGGMGKVYLVTDIMLPDEKVALKVLNADLGNQDALIQRFLREVQLTRRVTHQNVVRTFDVGSCAGRLYFTMEYIEGKTLRDLVDGQPLPIEEALRYLDQLCSGLASIHNHDIVHRDLKSSNVIVTSGGLVKITDFGVARPGASDLTTADELLGSATHIAPETWKDGEATAHSDIYALGVIAYEMVTGILPFDGRSPHELMFKHLRLAAVPPVDINPEVPRWLNSLILRMLDKDPALRPPSAEAVSKEAHARLRRSTVEDVRGLSGDDEIEPPFGEEGPLLEQYADSSSSDGAMSFGPITTELSFAERVRFTHPPATLDARDAGAYSDSPAGLRSWRRRDSLRQMFPRHMLAALGVFSILLCMSLIVGASSPRTWEWASNHGYVRGNPALVSSILTFLSLWLLVAAPLVAASYIAGETFRIREVFRVMLMSMVPYFALVGYAFVVLVSWGAHYRGQNTLGVLANASAVAGSMLSTALWNPLEGKSFVVVHVGQFLQLSPRISHITAGEIPFLIAPLLLVGVIAKVLHWALPQINSGRLILLALLAVGAPVLTSLALKVELVSNASIALPLGLTTSSTPIVALAAYLASWITVWALLIRWRLEREALPRE
jgi:serine/threonine protein kinase